MSPSDVTFQTLLLLNHLKAMDQAPRQVTQKAGPQSQKTARKNK